MNEKFFRLCAYTAMFLAVGTVLFLFAYIYCVGNGFNDIPMFMQAALSVAVIGHEGACGTLLAQADVMVISIGDALDLLLRRVRLTATLRS